LADPRGPAAAGSLTQRLFALPYLVPALALAPDGTLRRPVNPAFLLPAKPLAILFRAKLRAALRQTDLYAHIPRETWQQAWVVDCRAVGSGAAALTYLAPYIFRVALSNNRIVGVQDDRVTFRYRDGDSKQIRTCTLPALAFIGRFLQHVLPKGFVKVRYYGLFRVGNRRMLEQVRAWLAPLGQTGPSSAPTPASSRPSLPSAPAVLRCPACGQSLQLVQTIPRQSRAPPAWP
jgi:Putative transposase